MGTSTARLTVLPSRTVFLTGQPMANISDHLTMVNLAPFGRCRSLGFPPTAAATAAHHGHLTPMPCMHNTPMPWMGGKMDCIVKGEPALLKSSKCQCMWGGTISLVTDGQMPNAPADMTKVPKTDHNTSSSSPSKKSDYSSSADDKAPNNANNDSTSQNNNNNGNSGNNLKTNSGTKQYTRQELSAWVRGMTKEERQALREAANELPDNLTSTEKLTRLAQLFDDAPNFSTKGKLAYVNNCIALEKELGINKGSKMTIEQADKQNANPKYTYRYIADPKGPLVINGVKCRENPDYDKQYSINCATCSAAYALRLAGFDVKAKGNTPGTLNESLSHNPHDIWNNPNGTKASPQKASDWMTKNKVTSMTADDYRKYFNDICKEEGVYEITLSWKSSGGHATILQRDSDGKLYYIEPQVYDSSSSDGRRSIDDLILDGKGNLKITATPKSKDGIMRVDNKLLNPDYASLFYT